MSLERDLSQIGLEEKEASVYLASLELGSANIQNLTKKSEIKRSTVYEMIKNLKKKGLISETIKGKRKLFIASEPENIKRNIKMKEQLLNDIMPELKSINNNGFKKPKITFYEGRDELREIYQDTLTIKKGLIYAISPSRSIIETVGEDFLNKYIEERAKNKIRTKLIHITSNMAEYKYLDPRTFEKTLREVRFTPEDIEMDNVFVIYENKVAVLSTKKESFGFVVESKDYAQSMKMLYDLLWNISRPQHEMDFNNQHNGVKNKDNKSKEEDDY